MHCVVYLHLSFIFLCFVSLKTHWIRKGERHGSWETRKIILNLKKKQETTMHYTSSHRVSLVITILKFYLCSKYTFVWDSVWFLWLHRVHMLATYCLLMLIVNIAIAQQFNGKYKPLFPFCLGYTYMYSTWIIVWLKRSEKCNSVCFWIDSIEKYDTLDWRRTSTPNGKCLLDQIWSNLIIRLVVGMIYAYASKEIVKMYRLLSCFWQTSLFP